MVDPVLILCTMSKARTCRFRLRMPSERQHSCLASLILGYFDVFRLLFVVLRGGGGEEGKMG